MDNLYPGPLSVKKGVAKREGNKPCFFFNKASAKLGNVWTLEQREEMIAKTISKAKKEKRLLNVSGKKVGLGNYHTAAQLEKLLKKYDVECFKGFKGSVYLALVGEPQVEAATDDLSDGAVTF